MCCENLRKIQISFTTLDVVKFQSAISEKTGISTREKHNFTSGRKNLQNIIDDPNDHQVAGHTSPTAEETVFFEPFVDLDLALGEEGRLVQAEAKAAIQMVSYCVDLVKQSSQRTQSVILMCLFLIKVIQPSFRAFAEFLQLEYLPNTRLALKGL